MQRLNKKIQKNTGMTYVELIVVLGIFSVLSSIAIYNYGLFQGKIDVKNLASDIALKIVEAQKSSLSGKLPPLAQQSQNDDKWKPSYGLFFDTTTDKKSFIYFTDLDGEDGVYDTTSTCPGSGECLEKITITKGNYISGIDSYSGSLPTSITAPLSITFKRPDSRAVFESTDLPAGFKFDYVQITIVSPRGTDAKIKIYPSGRIQVN